MTRMHEDNKQTDRLIYSKSVNISIILFGICLIIFSIWQIMLVADVNEPENFTIKFMMIPMILGILCIIGAKNNLRKLGQSEVE